MAQQVKSIPVSVALRALKRGEVRELMLLVELKSCTHGWFKKAEMLAIFENCGVKVYRTFEKQVGKLVRAGWLIDGDGQYSIRGWEEYGRLNGLSVRKRIRYDKIDGIIQMRAFLFAGVVGYEVKRIKHYFEKTESGQRAARLSWRGYRSFDRKGRLKQRFGVSMERISGLIGLSREYMVRMKGQAKKFGYLVCSAIFVEWGSRRKQLNDEVICGVSFVTRKTVTQK